MFNNLLTSIGVGSISADTRIENNVNYENDLKRCRYTKRWEC
ncbi:hypothetical protein [Mammaliicoccus lentus]|jgi:sporulation-control protein spo0M